MTTDTGARYAIVVNGVVRSNRDALPIALAAATYLRTKAGNPEVVVRDLVTGNTVGER
jgi:hypothetical protein